MDDAGLPWRLRRPVPQGVSPLEVDLVLEVGWLPVLDEALARAGFVRYRAPGYRDHRFHVAHASGVWVKIDTKVQGRRRLPELVHRVVRRLPAGLRRSGPVVVLLGEEAMQLAGKLEQLVPVGVVVIPVRGRGPFRQVHRARAHLHAWAGRVVLCPVRADLPRADVTLDASDGRMDRASEVVWDALAACRGWPRVT